MGKFKVGDRVRVNNTCPEHIDEKGSIISGKSVYKVKLDKGVTRHMFERELEKVEEKEMEYEVGKPYLWFGGECPLPPGTEVELRFGKSDFSEISKHWHPYRVMREAGFECYWGHCSDSTYTNIVMFKVVEYPKQTRKVELELSEEEITTIKEVLEKLNT